MCDHYSRAETNQGRKLLIIRKFLPRKLFRGGNYSRKYGICFTTFDFALNNRQLNSSNFEISQLLDSNKVKQHQGNPESHQTVIGQSSESHRTALRQS